MAFMQGILNVGDPMATPIIRQLRSRLDRTKTVILDSPPGTSCPVIETVRGSDFCILVTEPTPFGLHDLQLAVETVRELKVPFGVIINCAGIGDDAVENYCQREAYTPFDENSLGPPHCRRVFAGRAHHVSYAGAEAGIFESSCNNYRRLRLTASSGRLEHERNRTKGKIAAGQSYQ